MKVDEFVIQGEELKALMKDMEKARKQASKTRKRKSGFEVKWVKVPVRWIERLRIADIGVATY